MFLTTIITALTTQLVLKNEFKQNRPLYLFVGIFISVLLVVIFSWWFSGLMLENALNQHDVNRDGVFSTEEQTPEQQKLMDRFIGGDGARNIALVILGPIYSLLITIVITLISIINVFVKKNKSRKVE